MQFSTITFPLLALFLTNTLAMPSSPNPNTNPLETRSNDCATSCSCGTVVPAPKGFNVVGKTKCRCYGQVGDCDLLLGETVDYKQLLICGQDGSGCVWV
ncbi:uncharacterized protein EAF01_005415 [Botrytis porri]|uniref:Uncharacterized protein n=1 Tax=Botrytis porri TaxID=87229 RepID=A0A4Z1KRF4_9HELO|nr:uncharacterized protein EAF01_005415 [Botrytis porri]KAF7904893.1 hypothetical protein EAF01_005415 [Botrytis porri]TGO87662.1 hypothetical protein BPOR_0211g00010 [Botrytis porri]